MIHISKRHNSPAANFRVEEPEGEHSSRDEQRPRDGGDRNAHRDVEGRPDVENYSCERDVNGSDQTEYDDSEGMVETAKGVDDNDRTGAAASCRRGGQYFALM